jgi:SagB-type dehydrogenase family enzyme
MRLKSNIFFKFHNGKLILWDFEDHKQYELNDEFAFKIYNLAQRPDLPVSEDLFTKLAELNLLEEHISKVDKEWGWDLLSLIYHKGTSDLRGNVHQELMDDAHFIDEYIEHSTNIVDSYKFLPLYSERPIPLSKTISPVLTSSNFFETLCRRKTCRNFVETKVTYQELSDILSIGFGNFHSNDHELEDHGFVQYSVRKTSPSGGNIHPEEAFIYVFNVEKLKQGIYYYNNELNTLHEVSEEIIDYEELKVLLNYQFFAEGCSFVIFFVSRFDKIWWKYQHSRSYRFANLEMGAFVQTTQLIATAHKLNFWQTGVFQDSKISSLLKLEGHQACLFVMAIGQGDGNAIPRKFLKNS